jgi:cyclopropane fatty-acyl-phospholipid synthase-like methyltransferase
VPSAKVIGVDLSPIQPSLYIFLPLAAAGDANATAPDQHSISPNVTFEIDDLEDTWTFSQKFDFVHSRMMTGSFTDWPRFFKQAYESVLPSPLTPSYSISPLLR